MGDEKEGPYKVVATLSKDRLDATRYMIVEQHRNDVFLRVLIPDSGSGETSRKVCNMLNKDWKEGRGAEGDGTGSTDESGLSDHDQ